MRKGAALFLTLVLIAPVSAGAAVTYGRDKLKGTTKTQGDFNLGSHFTVLINGSVAEGVTSIQGLGIALNSIKVHPPNHTPAKVSIGIGIKKSYSPADLAWRQSVLN